MPNKPQAKNKPTFTTRLANSKQDIELAQALRAKTFGAEFGLVFENGLDQDKFDEVCRHVLVFSEDEKKLVATTRLMDSKTADKLGQFYTENEFDLTELLTGFKGNILEVGRSCVDTDFRSMSAINALWQGIGSVANDLNATALLGCASIPIENGDIEGWLAELDGAIKVAAQPKYALPAAKIKEVPKLPPLLKAYLRMGSLVGDKACYDVEFKCADVLIWFPLSRMDQRYLSRFVQQ